MITYRGSLSEGSKVTLSVPILAGQAYSDAVFLPNAVPVSVMVPNGWTAAQLAVEGSLDGTTFVPILVGGTRYSSAVTATGCIIVFPEELEHMPYIRLRSEDSDVNVIQTASMALQLHIMYSR